MSRVQVDLHDPRQLLGAESVEDHDFVEPVQELRLECAAYHTHHGISLGLHVQRLVREELRAQIGGQDQQGVAEVNRTPLAVGQPAVIEYLQQDVENLGMRLLHFVQEHHRVRAATNGLGELAAFLITDIAGRCADEPSHRMLLGVLAHVDPDHGPLIIEEELSNGLGQFGLADASRTKEQE